MSNFVLHQQQEDTARQSDCLEEIQPPKLFGIIKKPEDPSIKSLFTWQDESPKARPKGEYCYLTEMRDSYRGFYFKPEEQKMYRGSPCHQSPRPNENLNNESLDQELQIEASIEPQEQLPKPQKREPIKANIKPLDRNARSRSSIDILKPHRNPSSGGIRTQRLSKGSKRPSSAKPIDNEAMRKERQDARIKKLNQTTRWLPNSAFTTYFGKPAFENYGQGNINPTYGGLMYGNYMKSHNIAPHEGQNNPQYSQVYFTAEKTASRKKPRSPEPPRKCKDEDRLAPQQIEEMKQRNKVLAEDRVMPSREIVKPDLYKVKTFKSEHNTPNVSVRIEKEKKDAKKIEHTSILQTPISVENKQIEKKSETSKLQAAEAKTKENSLENGESKEKESIEKEEQENNENMIDKESLAGSSCEECVRLNPNKRKLVTTYQDMTSRLPFAPKQVVEEPFKYCAKCLEALYPSKVEDVKPENLLKPPHSLGEIPFQELNPKNYKTLPPQWTQRIPAAGKLSYKSPTAYEVIFQGNE
ncbi:unnamed protein product [Blepharisma stoltei]|uniref:Uncharacterized protein n=1 Tax=Blepharisma stoltei TaxID=1481888 RepID=A0AAU9KAP6_9CILI|nr:unnamed protein product [Blepharisma stoltei]